ncbi:2-oxo acid dehydrogenase subunit E2 [bacterium]|nr:2-oxo acid dehydrogenase subunit E2 [bacterium]
MLREVKIPEISENVDSGDVTKVFVKAGDTVSKDQPLLELETDKAVVELPSPASGKVTEILVKGGEKVNVGQVVAKIEVVEGAEEDETTTESQVDESSDDGDREEVSDSSKDIESENEELHFSEADSSGNEHDSEKTTIEDEDKATAQYVADSAKPSGGEPRKSQGLIRNGRPRPLPPASPTVRRLAREIGVDINEVRGSGPRARITKEDVKAHAKGILLTKPVPEAAGFAHKPLPEFHKWGNVRREKMSKIRQITADSLSYAWTTIPHVTQHDKADVTQLEEFRKKYGKLAEKQGGKLTVTAILMKVIAEGLKKFPQFNSSIDMRSYEIIYKDYYNVGVAVDTPLGLIVPVIRGVDKKSMIDIAVEMTELASRTRDRKVKPEELEGGNFTISNLGGIGGTSFTPIVYAPQVAILGVSRTQVEPVWKDGTWEPRMMLPLSLSYDHRIIDGADAARFARWIAEVLENPLTLFL